MNKLLKIIERRNCNANEVTIICCAKDSSLYIKNSLQSILEQKSVSAHVMFLNDASSDSTMQMAEDILQSSNFDFTIYQSLENIGVPRSRNFLISQSESPYIAIHDSDDISMPYRLAIQLDFLKKQENIDAVGSRAIKIDDHDGFVGLMSYPPVKHDDILLMLTGKVNPMIDPTTMFRKRSFDELGGYSESEEIRLAQDFDLWIRMCKKGKKLANLEAPLVAYRSHTNGLTASKKNDMIKAHVNVQFRHQNFLENIRRTHVRS